MESDERVSGVIRIDVGGHIVELNLNLPTEPVKPHRALPVFQHLTNTFVDLSVKAVEENGEKVSCKVGCAACCRQPVPVSEIEVYQIAELVESMPEPKRSEVKKRFADVRGHFERIGWFQRLRECDEMGRTEERATRTQRLRELIDEYFRENVPCPFLEDEACSIYPWRPLVCREYVVVSPAENCFSLDRNGILPVQLLAHGAQIAQTIGRTGRMAELGLLPLIRALELTEEFPEAFESKAASEWLGEFFGKLSTAMGATEDSGDQPMNNDDEGG